MGRGSRIREAVKRALWTLREEGFQVCYVHRDDAGQRVKCVSSDLILYADSWAVHLLDGSSIPYHRIVEIRLPDGRRVWSRREGWTGGK